MSYSQALEETEGTEVVFLTEGYCSIMMATSNVH